MAQITTKANVLRSGAVSVSYAVRSGRGLVHGAVMFDEKGRVYDQTRETLSTKGRGFCELDELPSGVYAAARAARKAAVA